jgi:hypothetical protein
MAKKKKMMIGCRCSDFDIEVMDDADHNNRSSINNRAFSKNCRLIVRLFRREIGTSELSRATTRDMQAEVAVKTSGPAGWLTD